MADPTPIIEPSGKDTPPAPTPHGTYNHSVPLPDHSGVTPNNSPPPGAFVNPDPRSVMLNDAWDKRTNPK